MGELKSEVLYGISIDGRIPTLWSEKYPTQEEIAFNSAPQYESIEIVEKDVSYFKVATIR